MDKQYLIIHNYQTLYDILYELKNILGFEIKFVKNNELQINKLNSNELIISKKNLKLEKTQGIKIVTGNTGLDNLTKLKKKS